MSHKDSPPETPSQTACREWWQRAQPHVSRAWGQAKSGAFLAEETRLLHEAWCAAAHLAQPAQSVDGRIYGFIKVGFLSVQRWKGIDSMINTDFDYTGDLPDGDYPVYVTTAALQEKGNGSL